jgi:hypothetical protein
MYKRIHSENAFPDLNIVDEEEWAEGLNNQTCGIVRIGREQNAFQMRMGVPGHWPATEITYDVIMWLKYSETCREFLIELETWVALM